MQSLYVNVFSTEMGGLCCKNSTRVQDETSVIRRVDPENPPIGKLLIFVNPKSGHGKGVNTFRKKVKPRLEKNNILYELVVTSAPNEARSIVSNRTDLNTFNGIIIVSGDGLIFEVVNALCSRKDAYRLVSRMPIGIVPTGSGNGLLSSVFHANSLSLKAAEFLRNSVDIVTSIRPEAQPVNLFHVQTEKENIAAFLSVGWGLMADIDIESERWRSMLGSNRFVLTGLVRALNLRSYRGKLSYKPYTASAHVVGSPFDVYSSSKVDMLPLQDCSSSDEGNVRPLDDFWRCAHLEDVPDIEKDVDSDWITIDEDFIGIYAVTLSHISMDGNFMPNAKLDDDRIYLTYVLKKDIKNKVNIIKYLTAIDGKGSHLELDVVKSVEVSSFRLEPENREDSYLVVDGEVIDCCKLQATTTSMKTAVFT